MNKKAYGFTIVELLIAIVVIGILAAISITVYSGVSAKARDAQRDGNISNLLKKMELYKVENGSYFPDDLSLRTESCNYRFIGLMSSGMLRQLGLSRDILRNPSAPSGLIDATNGCLDYLAPEPPSAYPDLEYLIQAFYHYEGEVFFDELMVQHCDEPYSNACFNLIGDMYWDFSSNDYHASYWQDFRSRYPVFSCAFDGSGSPIYDEMALGAACSHLINEGASMPEAIEVDEKWLYRVELLHKSCYSGVTGVQVTYWDESSGDWEFQRTGVGEVLVAC